MDRAVVVDRTVVGNVCPDGESDRFGLEAEKLDEGDSEIVLPGLSPTVLRLGAQSRVGFLLSPRPATDQMRGD